MKIKDLLEVKSNSMPEMEVPGVKVRMLESWRSKLPEAIRALGYEIEIQGYESGSTVWACAFAVKRRFNIEAFEKKLRDKLNFGGWIEVKFFDLEEPD